MFTGNGMRHLVSRAHDVCLRKEEYVVLWFDLVRDHPSDLCAEERTR